MEEARGEQGRQAKLWSYLGFFQRLIACPTFVLGGGVYLTDLSPIYRIAGLGGILVAVLNIFLIQAERKEQAQMLSLAGVIIVLLWLVQMVGELFSSVEAIFRW